MRPKRRSGWVFGLGLLVAGGIILWAWMAPHSAERFRWFVMGLLEPNRLDPYAFLRLSKSRTAKSAVQHLRQCAAQPQFSDDWQVELGVAFWEYDWEYDSELEPNKAIPQHVEALWELSRRYPERPEILASLLRHAVWPLAGNLLNERAQGAQPRIARSAQQIEILNERRKMLGKIVEWVRQASRSDAENAYFPQMESVMLWALGRDTEAIQALHRAAQKKHWDDYPWVEYVVTRHFLNKNRVPRLGVVEAYNRLTILYPHYASIRSVAQMMPSMVNSPKVRSQVARDLVTVGTKMGRYSRGYLGCAVGNSVAKIGASALLGLPRHASLETIANRAKQKLSPTEARWLVTKMTAANQRQTAWHDAQNKGLNPHLDKMCEQSVRAHILSFALLGSAISMLLSACWLLMVERWRMPFLAGGAIAFLVSMLVIGVLSRGYWGQSLSDLPANLWEEFYASQPHGFWAGLASELGVDFSLTGSWAIKTVGITGIAWAFIGLCVILGSAGFGKNDSELAVPILRWALWGAGLVMIFLFALQWNHYLHLNERILHEFDKAVAMGFT